MFHRWISSGAPHIGVTTAVHRIIVRLTVDAEDNIRGYFDCFNSHETRILPRIRPPVSNIKAGVNRRAISIRTERRGGGGEKKGGLVNRQAGKNDRVVGWVNRQTGDTWGTRGRAGMPFNYASDDRRTNLIFISDRSPGNRINRMHPVQGNARIGDLTLQGNASSLSQYSWSVLVLSQQYFDFHVNLKFTNKEWTYAYNNRLLVALNEILYKIKR